MQGMRTTNQAQVLGCRVLQTLAGVLLFALLCISGIPKVIGDNDVDRCSNSKFNLSTFSSVTVALISHSWIDGDGSIRMAPPYRSPNSAARTSLGEGDIGQALYKTSVSVTDPSDTFSASFSTFFSFSLVSVKQVPPESGGLAFVLIPNRTTVPFLATESAEIASSSPTSHVFAVKLTKWRNEDSGGTSDDSSIGGPLFSSFLQDAAVNYAWIDYDAAALQLRVQVSNTSDGRRWTLLSTTFNLSGVLLSSMYAGFSSFEKVSIQSWSSSFDKESCAPLNATEPTGQQGQPLPEPPARPGTGSAIPPPPSNSPFPFGDGNDPPKKKQFWTDHRLIIYIGVSSAIATVVSLALAICVRILWRAMKYRGASSVPDRDVSFAPQIFTYRTLTMATNGFDERTLLGRGGFGSVYKGLIVDASSTAIVAVKRIESKNDAQRERQFIAEVSSIGRLRHRNLVQLLGWCHEKGELLLVYDYMPNGSLDRLLFGTQANARVLSWESRYNIVSGVAAALAYLHGEWEKQVVHRDVKASNVLLDSDFNPRLGDFGLARLIEHNKDPRSTAVAGTLGYLAPEITITGKATDKTDVFSFGALALEVACGRRPIERSLPPEQVVLVDWVWQLHSKDKLLDAIDPRLQEQQQHRQHRQHSRHRGESGENFFADSVRSITMLSIGLLCSHPDPGARPSMRQVVRMLNGELRCPAVPESKPVPPFSPFRPPPPDYYNSPMPTARTLMASAKLANNKSSSRTHPL